MFEMKEGNLYLGITVAGTSTDTMKISSIERTHGDKSGSKSGKYSFVQSTLGDRAGD